MCKKHTSKCCKKNKSMNILHFCPLLGGTFVKFGRIWLLGLGHGEVLDAPDGFTSSVLTTSLCSTYMLHLSTNRPPKGDRSKGFSSTLIWVLPIFDAFSFEELFYIWELSRDGVGWVQDIFGNNFHVGNVPEDPILNPKTSDFWFSDPIFENADFDLSSKTPFLNHKSLNPRCTKCS